jgi:hypothetical protein
MDLKTLFIMVFAVHSVTGITIFQVGFENFVHAKTKFRNSRTQRANILTFKWIVWFKFMQTHRCGIFLT